MYGCKSWTIKEAEHWRIDAFNFWCWRRHLGVPWTARRSNQSILKEINPEYLLEGLILKLKLQYFGHRCEELTLWKRPWCWERLKAGGEGDDSRWNVWMASSTQRTWVWANCGRWWRTGRPGLLQSMGLWKVRYKRKSVLNIHWRTDTEAEAPVLWPPDRKSWLSDWTTTTKRIIGYF